MGITSIEFLEDSVRILYDLQKPWGMRDEIGKKVDVLYKDVENLMKAPEEVGLGKTTRAEGSEIFIPRCNKTIMFIFDKYPERAMGPMEEDIYGPYLIDS